MQARCRERGYASAGGLMWLFVGCARVVHSPTCDRSTVEVSDEEEIASTSAAAGLQLAAGPYAAEGSLQGAPALVRGVVERGSGPAVASIGTPGSEEVRSGPGLVVGHSVLTIGVTCDSWLEVPAEVSLSSEDGSIDLVATGVLGSVRVGGVAWELVAEVEEGDIAAFPAIPGADLRKTLALQWDAQGLSSISLWSEEPYTQLFEAP